MQKNMYGWDFVFGISKDVMNTQLSKKSEQLITKFDYIRTPASGGEIHLEGQFGAWSILDGRNSLIYISIPIQQGTMTLNGGVFASFLNGTDYVPGKPFDISGISFVMETKLGFKSENDDINSQVLTFIFKAEGDSSVEQDCSITNISDTDHKLKNNSLNGLFKESMTELLSANKDKMKFIFAEVTNGSGKNHWFDSKYEQFYFSNPEGRKDGFLNILGMVYQDNSNGNQASIDPAFTEAEGTQLYLAFSQDLFLNKLIQPLLPANLGVDATSDSFKYDFTNHVIKNNGTINLKSVSKALIDYYPKINDLSISIDGDCLRIEFHGTCDMHIVTIDDMTFSCITNNKLFFDSSQGKFIIQPDPNPQTDHHLSIPWYDVVVAAAAASIGVGVVVGLIVVAVTYAVISAISHSVGDDSAEGFSATNLGNIPVAWTGVDIDPKFVSGEFDKNLIIIEKIKQ